MMNKNKKWLLAMSIATMLTANGLAMAATTSEQQTVPDTKQHLSNTQNDSRHQESFHKFSGHSKALLDFLKINEQTFKDDLAAGKTLAAIANEQGISEQDLKDFLIKQFSEHIDQAVQAGKLTSEQADQKKANLENRVEKMIQAQGFMAHEKQARPGHKPFDQAKLLAFLKMDEQTFKNDWKAGKSLAAIASEQGISEQELKDFLVKQLDERLAEEVNTGKLTSDQAEKMKENMQNHISDLVNGKGPLHHKR